MTAFTDYLAPETLASIRAKMRGYLVAAGSSITDWILGGVGQQIEEATEQAIWNEATQVSSLVRGYASLDTSVDPGDPDPYDPANASRDPEPGFLSAKGEGDYGTPRVNKTFATGTVTFTNNSSPATAVTFGVGTLTFTSSGTGNPTYRNTAGSPYSKVGGGTITAAANGSLTVPWGVSVYLPVQAEVIGTGSNASAGQLSLTTVLAPTGVSATNALSILGSDREAADLYREKCREAAALTSPNGPADAYRYLATTARDDGTYGNSATGTPLGVTRVYVSEASATGIATVYLATATGAPISGTVTTITGIIKTSPGVIAVPNTVTINVSGATNTTIAMQYTVKGKASLIPGGATAGTYYTPWLASTIYAVGQKVYNSSNVYVCTVAGTSASSGGPTGTGTGITDGGVTWDYVSSGSYSANVAAVLVAISNNSASYLASVPIGGNDQSGGAGVIYTVDLSVAIVTTTINNVPVGLYDPALTIPSGSSTSIALGHVGVLGAATGSLVLS